MAARAAVAKDGEKASAWAKHMQEGVRKRDEFNMAQKEAAADAVKAIQRVQRCGCKNEGVELRCA